MRTLLLLCSLLTPVGLAACGGADAAPAPRTGATPAATTAPVPEVQAECEAFFARARTCTAEYIPALVDLRVSLDKPAGIAAEAQPPGGRDAIIQQALGEWTDDSQPAAVAALCSKIAGAVPPAEIESDRAKAATCMAATDCATFSTCAMELQRRRIAAQ
jgi:hypothetical protein